MTRPSDEELMASYVAGDPAAFEAIYERYASRLAGVFWRGVPAGDVADLVQQTFLQLHRARRDFRPGAPLRPWLFSIAFNLKRKSFRDASRRGASLERDPAVDAGESADLQAREEAGRVRAALAMLRTGQREVIELHWFEGLPFAEVARRLGSSLSAVKVRAHRGYQKLRAFLEGT